MIENLPVKTTKYSTKIKKYRKFSPPIVGFDLGFEKNLRFLHITMGKI